jgi:hypothetical protein
MSDTVKNLFGQNVNYYPTYTFLSPPPAVFSKWINQHHFIHNNQEKVSQHTLLGRANILRGSIF